MSAVSFQQRTGMSLAAIACVIQAVMISLCCGTTPTVAANITYNFVSDPALQNGFSLTGTITTNGRIGVLDYSDIQSASFTVSNGVNTYVTGRASDVYGVEKLIATASQLSLPMSDLSNTFPHLKFGGAGFGTPQLQYDYFHYQSGSIISMYNCIADYPTTLVSVWQTPIENSMQLNGEPWLIATAVPEPSTFALLGMGVVSLIVCNWRRRSATSLGTPNR